MAPKKKEQEMFNPIVHPPLDLDRIPLADNDFKIHETLSEFDCLTYIVGGGINLWRRWIIY